MKSSMLTGVIAGVLVLCPASSALAGPTVTVRVEGQSSTLLESTTVTLPDAKAAGNPCTGANAAVTVAAALEEVTRGNWDRQSFTQRILGETHEFANNDYWAEWLNEKFGGGICSDVVQTGDRVLFLADVSGPNFEPTAFPLVLSAPRTVAPGSAFSVAATEYKTDGTAPAQPTPAAGVSVTGGATTATTGGDGKATVRLDQRGPAVLRAARANATRAEPVVVCVTDGADGFCGTSVPGAPAAPAPAAPAVVPDRVAAFGQIGSMTEGKRFAAGKGPRTLSGTVDPEVSGLRDVRLRLTRTDKGRCFKFDGVREAFAATRRCGIKNARTFTVGTGSSFSYLLPAALPAGRYVLDVVVYDRAFNQTQTYQRGRNRVVFFVG